MRSYERKTLANAGTWSYMTIGKVAGSAVLFGRDDKKIQSDTKNEKQRN